MGGQTGGGPRSHRAAAPSLCVATRSDPSAARGGQAVSLLHRLLRAAGADLPAGRDAFADDDGTVHEAAIDALAAAGIVTGFPDGGFQPGRSVTRAQLASYLARLLEVVVAAGRARPPSG